MFPVAFVDRTKFDVARAIPHQLMQLISLTSDARCSPGKKRLRLKGTKDQKDRIIVAKIYRKVNRFHPRPTLKLVRNRDIRTVKGQTAASSMERC
jgi:hypothetical protein